MIEGEQKMNTRAKVALITGAGQGIGRAIALRLAKDGADVALVDLKRDKMDAVAKEVQALGRRATIFVADVTSRDQVYAAVDHAEKELAASTSWLTMPGSLRSSRWPKSRRRKWKLFSK